MEPPPNLWRPASKPGQLVFKVPPNSIMEAGVGHPSGSAGLPFDRFSTPTPAATIQRRNWICRLHLKSKGATNEYHP